MTSDQQPAPSSKPSELHYYDGARQEKWRIPILHEDDSLIALNKPSGLPVIPERWHPEWPCLRRIATERLNIPILIVHRLDAGTSGLVLFAKHAAAHRALCRQFARHQVEKTYLALVQGEVSEAHFTIDRPIAANPQRPGVMKIARDGKPSATTIRVLERFRGVTLVEAKPQTGRQHQIRVHLQAIGHPLLVDPIYGRAEAFFLSVVKRDFHLKRGETEQPHIRRLTLHASLLRFHHPERQEIMALAAPEARDFNTVVKNLRKYAAK